ncbi:MAG: CHAT domain-containing protein [Oscillochloris sp.]|nr:CHAT domain-containing protein [Oscillochloris sp.]
MPLSAVRNVAESTFGTSQNAQTLATATAEQYRAWMAYEALVAPISAYAAPQDLVCLVPHGFLHALPLHILPCGDELLIERNPVFYVPSTSVLAQLRHRPPLHKLLHAEPPAIAFFGDSCRDLPAAQQEIESLSKMFGVPGILHEGVTYKAVCAALRREQIVHIAGHAYFQGAPPDTSQPWNTTASLLPGRLRSNLPPGRSLVPR